MINATLYKETSLSLRKARRGFIVMDGTMAGLPTPEWAFNTIEEVAEWLVEHFKEPQA